MAYQYPPANPGLLRVPAPSAQLLQVRFASLSERDKFNPLSWRVESLTALAGQPGWWQIDLNALALPDGEYEYEFVVDHDTANPVADPFAEEITKFGGYRGVFHVKSGQRVRRTFRWDDEMPAGVSLPNNNALVIYELPVRWMVSGPAELDRQVGLATFDRVVFERLNDLVDLGINAIELLPVQDSPDTLNWGYGTRFFFTADIDMGTPVDLKFFIKRCHQRGIRVLLDVVMNHAAAQCPLRDLAKDDYFIDQQDDRNGWGGALFRYDDNDSARDFHCAMAAFWIREFHVDGFRLDEFKSIKNYAFVQAFRERAWQEQQALFPQRPFLVIAEDSNRRFEITHDSPSHPNGRKVVDAIWNFSFRDEARLVLTNQLSTRFGQPSRADRIRMLITGGGMWDDYGGGRVREGYGDMAQSVNYVVSHDVKDGARMLTEIFGALLRLRGLGSGDVQDIRHKLKNVAGQSSQVPAALEEALDRCISAMALVLTSVGIPMFLAGEEFGDVHDLNPWEDTKMSDPVDWERRDAPGNRNLLAAVTELVKLRVSHPALQRNETAFFHMHPAMGQNDGPRVFAYCRTNAQALGSQDQVVVIANLGSDNFANYDVPWPWGNQSVTEIAARSGSPLQLHGPQQKLTLSLQPFQIRVIKT